MRPWCHSRRACPLMPKLGLPQWDSLLIFINVRKNISRTFQISYNKRPPFTYLPIDFHGKIVWYQDCFHMVIGWLNWLKTWLPMWLIILTVTLSISPLFVPSYHKKHLAMLDVNLVMLKHISSNWTFTGLVHVHACV